METFRRQSVFWGRWMEARGLAALATTRESVQSVQVETGVAVFCFLWLLGVPRFGIFGAGGEVDRVLFQMARDTQGLVLWGAQMLLLFSHGAVGAFWGVVLRNAEQVVEEIDPRWRLDRWGPRWRLAVTAVLVVGLHSAVLLRDMVRRPALFHQAGDGFPGAGIWGALSSSQGLVGVLGVLSLGVLLLALGNGGLRFFRWVKEFSRPTQVALGVTTGFVLLSSLGVRSVWRAQAVANAGPNLLVLAVDGLRGDAVFTKPSRAPRLERLMSRGRSYRRCVPSTPFPEETLKAFLTGQSPLQNGVRGPFPSAAEAALGPASLPALFRTAGYHTEVLTDAGGEMFSGWTGDFDRVRAPSGGAAARLLRASFENAFHLLPYVSGRWGRAVYPPLRGAPALADPVLLAEETSRRLNQLRFQNKFFLMVRWSGLYAPEGAFSWRSLDAAVDRVVSALQDAGLEETTWVAVWSPRGAAWTEDENARAFRFQGPVYFDAPFALVEPHLRSGARRWSWEMRPQDIAPTVLSAFQWSVPEAMDGRDVFAGSENVGEPPLLYFESSGWEDNPFPLPPPARLLVEDLDAPGHWTLDPAFVDTVLIGKRRLIQGGPERLEYIPGPNGAVFRYHRWNGDWSPDLASARIWAPQVKQWKAVLYQYLSRESGWRPQNDVWVPEAFLREIPATEE